MKVLEHSSRKRRSKIGERLENLLKLLEIIKKNYQVFYCQVYYMQWKNL